MLYRVYFNRSKDAPFIWSFDEGTQETEKVVRNVHIGYCRAWTHYEPKSGDNVNSPTAWIYVRAESVEMIDDCAYFTNL